MIKIICGGDVLNKIFTVDQKSYDTDSLSEVAKIIYENLNFVQQASQELSDTHAVLNRAKNAYIEDLKEEIVQKKSGIDFISLLQDD